MRLKFRQHSNGYITEEVFSKIYKPEFDLEKAYKIFKWYLFKYRNSKIMFDNYDFKVSAMSGVYWDFIFR